MSSVRNTPDIDPGASLDAPGFFILPRREDKMREVRMRSREIPGQRRGLGLVSVL